ncbi:hypothetical protein BDV19DRAFT_353080 [Aspergillus venezuelensis]
MCIFLCTFLYTAVLIGLVEGKGESVTGLAQPSDWIQPDSNLEVDDGICPGSFTPVIGRLTTNGDARNDLLRPKWARWGAAGIVEPCFLVPEIPALCFLRLGQTVSLVWDFYSSFQQRWTLRGESVERPAAMMSLFNELWS